ncbi:MAG: hypothetical protein HYX24_00675 [Candidatus Aenigmarchaeota archaeon]|nr:hypothetical protein [Candidatus Aenigmarchaeota archaeon]
MNLSSFSPREVREIAIAMIALSFVFSYPEITGNPLFFFYSLLSVGIAFVGHELSHKFAAQHYKYFAEFRMWNMGILMAIGLAILTGGRFVFAAPGAVVFGRLGSKRPKKSEVGKIAAAGPIFNIAVLSAFLFLYSFTGIELLRYAATVNAWLAIFNMLPIAPLDGEKVMKWGWKPWFLILILAVGGFFAGSAL